VGAFKDTESNKDAFEALQENEYIRYEDLPLKTKDGRLIQVEFVSNVYLVENEKVIQCNIRDITAHKQADKTLARLEKEFRNLVENAPVGIFRTTVNGDFLFLNDSLSQMLGFDSTQATMPLRAIQCYKNPMDRISILEIVQKEGRINNREIDVLTKTGETRNVLLSATLEKDILTGMVIDITAHKHSAERVQRQLEHLTALSAIDRVIASNFDLKLSLSEILNHVTKELGADAADILIFNSNSKMLEFGAEYGFRTTAVKKAQVRLG
jgi:PAS domain S-box-containing protein